MRTRTKRKTALILLAVLTALSVFAACSRKAEGETGQPGKDQRAAQSGRQSLGDKAGTLEAVPVDAATPWRTELASYVFGNAHLEALRVVDIVARVEGQLVSLNVEEGDLVKRDQVLASLDRDQLRLALDEARAQLDNTRSNYARDTLMLQKELTSKELVDNSRYQYETARTRYERAELNLRYATITAPFNGMVTKRFIEVGSMIRTNMILFNMADMSKLLARVYVPEKEMARINVGDHVEVESEMIQGRRFAGEVEMISPVVDPTTGTIKVTVHLTEGYDELKPGMFCSVFILTETHPDVMVISRKALLPDSDTPEVFVVDDSLHVHRRPIEIGIQQGDTLEVLSGLSPQEKVVLIGQENLSEGTPVKLSSGAEQRNRDFRPAAPAAAQ